MGQLKFAADKPVIVASQGAIQGGNVVLFDPRRRVLHVRSAADARRRGSEGVVVRLPLANEGSRQEASRAQANIIGGPAKSLGTDEPGFTTFDFVATAVLILSVFAGPALVWSLLRSASFG